MGLRLSLSTPVHVHTSPHTTVWEPSVYIPELLARYDSVVYARACIAFAYIVVSALPAFTVILQPLSLL